MEIEIAHNENALAFAVRKHPKESNRWMRVAPQIAEAIKSRNGYQNLDMITNFDQLGRMLESS